MFKRLKNTYNLWRLSQSAIIDNLHLINEATLRDERNRLIETAYLASISDTLVKIQKNKDAGEGNRRRYTISNLDELKAFVNIYAQITACKVVPAWYGSDSEFFSDFTVNAESLYCNFGEPVPLDVFSQEYRDYMLRFFAYIRGSEYREGDEGFLGSDLHAQDAADGTGFDLNADAIHSEYKSLLEEINGFKPGNVLEMGFGTGKICTLLSGSGYEYYGVDMSEVFVNAILPKINDKAAKDRIMCGSFFDIGKIGKKFDCVIFDKSFHHCLEQESLLNIIYGNTTDNARVILHRETIADVTPKLGLNIYSAESILQIYMRGWLELIFSMQYLQELCSRTKWEIIKDYEIDMGKIAVLEKVRI